MNDCSSGVAAVLSLVIPGAGQMCKGKIGIGLFWLVSVGIGYIFIFPGIILHIICVFNAASEKESYSEPYSTQREYENENDYEFSNNKFILQNGFTNNNCKICGHEIIIGEHSCSFCDKKREKIELIVKNLNSKLDIFDEINTKKEKQNIRIEIVEKIKELKAFDSKILKLVIKNDKLLTDIEEYIEDKEEKKYLEQKKKLSRLSSNLINLLEKAEKYNFIKDLEKERLAIAEVLYYIKKNNIYENDLEYIKTENNNNIEESFFSMEYLKNRVIYLEKVLNID